MEKSESFIIDHKNEFQVRKINLGKMKRIFWEKEEKIELDKSFSKNPHPDMATKELLADKFRVNVQKITNYFKNKRQKLRKDGKTIQRVFRDLKSQKVLKEPAKVMTTLQKTESVPLVKSEDEIAIVKMETIEPKSDYQDARAEDLNDNQPSTLGQLSEPWLEVPRSNSNQLIRKIPKMGLSAKTSSDSIRNRYKTNQHGPIRSLFPHLISHQPPQMSLNPPYFPINPSEAISMQNDENLDAIFENNLQKLDKSNDTGNETDSFECVSEQCKEAENKPQPSWFPFSTLYQSQTGWPNQSQDQPFLVLLRKPVSSILLCDTICVSHLKLQYTVHNNKFLPNQNIKILFLVDNGS